jgi:hypothetical protein
VGSKYQEGITTTWPPFNKKGAACATASLAQASAPFRQPSFDTPLQLDAATKAALHSPPKKLRTQRRSRRKFDCSCCIVSSSMRLSHFEPKKFRWRSKIHGICGSDGKIATVRQQTRGYGDPLTQWLRHIRALQHRTDFPSHALHYIENEICSVLIKAGNYR